MTQVRKFFRCFRCKYNNNVVVPHYFKGLKCRRCHTFNFFNFIPNHRRKFHNQHNFNFNGNATNFSRQDSNFSDDSFRLNVI